MSEKKILEVTVPDEKALALDNKDYVYTGLPLRNKKGQITTYLEIKEISQACIAPTVILQENGQIGLLHKKIDTFEMEIAAFKKGLSELTYKIDDLRTDKLRDITSTLATFDDLFKSYKIHPELVETTKLFASGVDAYNILKSYTEKFLDEYVYETKCTYEEYQPHSRWPNQKTISYDDFLRLPRKEQITSTEVPPLRESKAFFCLLALGVCLDRLNSLSIFESGKSYHAYSDGLELIKGFVIKILDHLIKGIPEDPYSIYEVLYCLDQKNEYFKHNDIGKIINYDQEFTIHKAFLTNYDSKQEVRDMNRVEGVFTLIDFLEFIDHCMENNKNLAATDISQKNQVEIKKVFSQLPEIKLTK